MSSLYYGVGIAISFWVGYYRGYKDTLAALQTIRNKYLKDREGDNNGHMG